MGGGKIETIEGGQSGSEGNGRINIAVPAKGLPSSLSVEVDLQYERWRGNIGILLERGQEGWHISRQSGDTSEFHDDKE